MESSHAGPSENRCLATLNRKQDTNVEQKTTENEQKTSRKRAENKTLNVRRDILWTQPFMENSLSPGQQT
jgi:hypothetical protein